MEPSEGLLRGSVLHESLHASGVYDTIHPYRGDSPVHYAPLLSSLRFLNKYKDTRIASVLDVGCGVGFGVKALWSLNFIASGCDVAPHSISTANARYIDPHKSSHPQCLLNNCFLVGSVLSIPFPSHSTDAILSAGLLEHVEPRDVPVAVSEMARVARQYVLLQIAIEPTMPVMSQFHIPSRGNLTAAQVLARDYRARAPNPVERTLMPRLYWIDAFSKYGFVLERNIPLPHWSCCAFVLWRNASSRRVSSRVLKMSSAFWGHSHGSFGRGLQAKRKRRRDLIRDFGYRDSYR